MTDGPKNLLEAVQHFADESVCWQYMVNLKWPDGKIVCPKCKSERVGVIASRRMLQCKEPKCRKQFSAKVDTIFEDSPLPLAPGRGAAPRSAAPQAATPGRSVRSTRGRAV